MHVFSQNAGKYGLLMAVLNALYVLFMHYSGQYGAEYKLNPLDFLFIIVVPFVVWWTAIEAKKKGQKGKLNFSEGLNEGFQISVVYAVLSPFVYAFYYLTLNPGIVASLKYEYGFQGVSDLHIVFVDILAQFFSAIVFGTLYAAIISYILKSKSKKK